jgi:hypothetical protein
MAFRTNYRFQRTERDRAKQAKKEEKLKRRQDRGTAEHEANAPEHPDDNPPSEE